MQFGFLMVILTTINVAGYAHIPIVSRRAGTIKGTVLSNSDFSPVDGAKVSLTRMRGSVVSAADKKFKSCSA